jgi:predicted 2-oxoglutarate/Fe(II)-dependent dioxygenase YbiX
MEVTRYGAGIFTIADFLSADECAQFIHHSETHGFEEAVITTLDGPQLLKEARNNDRIIFDDPKLAQQLFSKAQALLPATLSDCQLLGLNERFRFYRYQAGQYFKWHKDGSFRRDEHEFSLLTLLIYLNEDYQGGATAFRFDTIRPRTGMALVFPHLMMHQGDPIVAGVKYVLRTDVMYRVDGAVSAELPGAV